MTIITNAERPFEKGKCPMCGADVVYTAFGNQHSKPWKCTGCGGYGREDKTGFGPLHIDLKTVQGTDVVLMEPEDYAGPIVQVDLCNEAPPAEPEYPRTALFQSDYSPDTTMRITMTEDGDVIFKIRGPGEMRIATSGGHFHGKQLAKFCEAAKAMLEVAKEIIISPLRIFESHHARGCVDLNDTTITGRMPDCSRTPHGECVD